MGVPSESQIRKITHARQLLAAGDGAQALAALAGFFDRLAADEAAPRTPESAQVPSPLSKLGPQLMDVLAAALLSCVLTPIERGTWQSRLARYLDDLLLQERTAEVLKLAHALGQAQTFIVKTARAGMPETAVTAAMDLLRSPQEILALVQILSDLHHQGMALRLAEHGLGLPDQSQKIRLAAWLIPAAESAGEIALALKAAIYMFAHHPSLPHYWNVERLAGDEWPEIKPGLLELLAQSSNTGAKAAIYLAEGMVDEVIALADAAPTTLMLADVIELATPTHPAWCAEQCTRQAEAIILRGVAAYYDEAVKWLSWARDCYRACGRMDEWQAYLTRLIAANRRKLKLIPLLQALR